MTESFEINTSGLCRKYDTFVERFVPALAPHEKVTQELSDSEITLVSELRMKQHPFCISCSHFRRNYVRRIIRCRDVQMKVGAQHFQPHVEYTKSLKKETLTAHLEQGNET